MKVVEGVELRDPFAILSAEGRVQYHFYHKDLSAYTVRVTSTAHADSLEIDLLSSSYGAGSFRSEQPLFLMTQRSVEAVLSTHFRSMPGSAAAAGKDILQQWGIADTGSVRHALALPWQLALLVLHGVWSEVLLLGQWRVQQCIFDSWPSDELFSYKSRALYQDVVDVDERAPASSLELHAAAAQRQ